MASCPLCSDILLRHIRSGKSYWLCRRCRLEILEKSYPTPDALTLPLPQLPVEGLAPLQPDAPRRHKQPQLIAEV